MRENTCATCAFHGRETAAVGTCRVEAPKINYAPPFLQRAEWGFFGEFPWVASDAWCGRHGKSDRIVETPTTGVEVLSVKQE